MNKFKKIITIMLSLIILTVSVSVCPAAAASDEYEADMAVEFAKEMGIIDEYTPDAEIKVGELAKVVDIISGGRRSDKIYFEEYRYERKSKLVEAIEVLLDVAGLRQLVNVKYGEIDTNASLIEADRAGLLDGITVKTNAYLTEGDLVRLVYNLLYVNIAEATYFLDGEVGLKMSKDLYMEAALDMYELNGILESASFTSISDKTGTQSNYVIIDGQRYFCDIGKYDDFVGCNVQAIIRNKGKRQEIVSLIDQSKILRVNANDISKVISKYEIEYYKSKSRIAKIKIDSSANVLYNFTLYDEYTASDFEIEVGELVLIDNDSDGKYDVVRIEEYDSMYIFASSAESEQIMDPYGLTLSTKYLIDNDIPVDVNGSLVPASALGNEQIGTYFCNKEGNITKLYVTDFKKISGYVDSIKPEINEIQIDGKKYTYTGNAKNRIEALNDRDMVTVILDKFGTVAYVESSRDGYSWGYLINFTEGQGINGPKFKVYTEDAKFEVYELKNKITLNGRKVDSANLVKYDLSTGLWDEIGKNTMLIKYKLDKDKKIVSLFTPTNDQNDTSGRPISAADGVFMYLKSSGNITPKYRLSPETIVFLIPNDTSFEDRYKVGTRLLLDNAREYTTNLYNIDENYYPEVMVGRIENYAWGQVDEWTWNARIIEKVGLVKNDNGNDSVVVHVRSLSDGTKDRLVFVNPDLNSIFGSKIVKPKDLKPGDIIQVYVNEADASEITDFAVRSLGTGTIPYEKTVGNSWRTTATVKRFYSEGGSFCFGKVTEIIKDGIVINNTADLNSDWDRTCSYTNATPVWLFKNSNQSLDKASVTDIAAGDYVYNGYSGGKLQVVVIYRD